jgi:hypothetical protein
MNAIVRVGVRMAKPVRTWNAPERSAHHRMQWSKKKSSVPAALNLKKFHGVPELFCCEK